MLYTSTRIKSNGAPTHNALLALIVCTVEMRCSQHAFQCAYIMHTELFGRVTEFSRFLPSD